MMKWLTRVCLYFYSSITMPSSIDDDDDHVKRAKSDLKAYTEPVRDGDGYGVCAEKLQPK